MKSSRVVDEIYSRAMDDEIKPSVALVSLNAIAKVATILGSIPASSEIVELWKWNLRGSRYGSALLYKVQAEIAFLWSYRKQTGDAKVALGGL